MPDTAIGMDRCYCEPKLGADFSDDVLKIKIKERFILRGKGSISSLKSARDVVVAANTRLDPRHVTKRIRPVTRGPVEAGDGLIRGDSVYSAILDENVAFTFNGVVPKD